MTRKWMRVLAAAMAVVLTIPANLPNRVSAASTVEKKAVSVKTNSSSYSYSRIGTTDYYVRYLNQQDVTMGATVTVAVSLVTLTSNGKYVQAGALDGVSYEWKKGIIQNDEMDSFSDSFATTASIDLPYDSGMYTSEGYGHLQAKVSYSSQSTVIVVDLIRTQPFTITEGAYSVYGLYRNVGQTATFNATCQPADGYTMHYQWYRDVKTETGVVRQEITGATGATYTTPALTESDFTSYYCEFYATNGTLTSDKTVFNYSVYTDSALYLSETSVNYEKALGESLNLSMIGLRYDAAAYDVTYQWMKYGEKIEGATTNQYSIAALTKDDFASYSCRAAIFKKGTDTTVSENEVDSETKSFYVNEKIGFWFYTGQTELRAAQGAKVSLDSYALTGGTQYAVTYAWAKYDAAEDEYVPLTGQTTSSYVMDAITLEQYGEYRVTAMVMDGDRTLTAESRFFQVSEDKGWAVNMSTQNVAKAKIGDTINLTTNISSSEKYPLNYTWYDCDHAVIPNATASSYSLKVANDDCYGSYYCVVDNGEGGSSTTIQFTVISNSSFQAVPITPTIQYKKLGGSATLKVRANSEDASAGYEFMWRYCNDVNSSADSNWISLHGQITDTLSLANIDYSDFGSYSCEVTNIATGESDDVYFDVNLYTRVTLGYTNDNSVFSVDESSPVTMSVDVSNPDNLPLTYAWNFYGNDGENTYNLPGGSSNTFSIAALAAGQYGKYTCRVYTNDIYLNDISFLVKKDTKSYLKVTRAADSYQHITLGGATSMAVTAETKEGRTLQYQWYDYNNRAILGATDPTYSIAAMKVGDYGTYYCKVTDGVEESVSLSFRIYQKTSLDSEWEGGTASVIDDETIVSIPGTWNQAQELKVTVTDDPNYPTSYQWYFSKENINTTSSLELLYDATSANYTIATLNADTIGYYTCRVSNAYDTYYINYYVYADTGLTVKTADTNYEVAVGSPASFAASAKCASGFNLSYQWYKLESKEYLSGGSAYTKSAYQPISGATAANYDIAAVTKDSYGTYRLTVKTEGESRNIYFYLSEPSKLEIQKIKSSTSYTLPGSTITLEGTVAAAQGVTPTLQWYQEDSVTGSDIQAKTADGKKATAAKVQLTAPKKICPSSTTDDALQEISYRLEAKAVINGVTTYADQRVYVTVVDPTMGTSLPKSAHNYKADTITTAGYKTTGSVKSLKVTFDSKFSIDKEGDVLYLIDGNGKATPYYGKELASKTVTLAGKKFAVVIDSSNEDAASYGYAVTKIAKVASTSFRLTKSKVSLGMKEKYKIKYKNAPSGKKVKFSTSKKKVASVTAKGVVTAKKLGKATITVKAGTKKLKLNVTVKKAPKKIKTTKKVITVKRGKSAVMPYKLTSSKAASEAITIKNAKVLKKAKITVTKTADGKLKVAVAKKAKAKKTYKVQIATYNGKKTTFKVKVK